MGKKGINSAPAADSIRETADSVSILSEDDFTMAFHKACRNAANSANKENLTAKGTPLTKGTI